MLFRIMEKLITICKISIKGSSLNNCNLSVNYSIYLMPISRSKKVLNVFRGLLSKTFQQKNKRKYEIEQHAFVLTLLNKVLDWEGGGWGGHGTNGMMCWQRQLTFVGTFLTFRSLNYLSSFIKLPKIKIFGS